MESNIEFSSPAVLKPHILEFPPKPTLSERASGVCCNDLLDSRPLLTPTKPGGHHSKEDHSARLLSLQSQTFRSELIFFKPGRGVDEELAVSWAHCWRSDSPRHISSWNTVESNIEFSCPAASTSHHAKFPPALPPIRRAFKADNCNDLLTLSNNFTTTPLCASLPALGRGHGSLQGTISG